MQRIFYILLLLPFISLAQNNSQKTPVSKNHNWNETPGNSFYAVPNQDKVLVYWSTVSETNDAAYFIEKSSDGVNFKTISQVSAAGHTQQITDYTEVDYQPYGGTSYYRIKQKDAKGGYAYSNVIVVKNNSASTNNSDASVAKSTALANENPNKKETLVLMMDASGNEQYSKVIVTNRDHHLYAVDPESRCSPGTYLVVASSNNKLYSQKLIVD